MPKIDMDHVRALVREAGDSLSHPSPYLAIVKTLVALHALVGLEPPAMAEKREKAVRMHPDA